MKNQCYVVVVSRQKNITYCTHVNKGKKYPNAGQNETVGARYFRKKKATWIREQQEKAA